MLNIYSCLFIHTVWHSHFPALRNIYVMVTVTFLVLHWNILPLVCLLERMICNTLLRSGATAVSVILREKSRNKRNVIWRNFFKFCRKNYPLKPFLFYFWLSNHWQFLRIPCIFLTLLHYLPAISYLNWSLMQGKFTYFFLKLLLCFSTFSLKFLSSISNWVEKECLLQSQKFRANILKR